MPQWKTICLKVKPKAWRPFNVFRIGTGFAPALTPEDEGDEEAREGSDSTHAEEGHAVKVWSERVCEHVQEHPGEIGLLS